MREERPSLKEASKILEYSAAVETGLQAAEILQAAYLDDIGLRTWRLREAGLVQVQSYR